MGISARADEPFDVRSLGLTYRAGHQVHVHHHDWAQLLYAGTSLRSLQRHFLAETGMTIEQWRQQARLLSATALLSNGQSAVNTALDCGYDSPSAFIAAFKRHFGETPGQFARQARS